MSVTPEAVLTLLRYAFLAGLLVLVVQAIRAAFANIEVPAAAPRGRSGASK